MHVKIEGSKALAAIQLTRKVNYEVWAYTMREHLMTLKLFEYVGESPLGQSTSGSL